MFRQLFVPCPRRRRSLQSPVCQVLEKRVVPSGTSRTTDEMKSNQDGDASNDPAENVTMNFEKVKVYPYL